MLNIINIDQNSNRRTDAPQQLFLKRVS